MQTEYMNKREMRGQGKSRKNRGGIDTIINVNVNKMNRNGWVWHGNAGQGMAWLGVAGQVKEKSRCLFMKCENCKYVWEYKGTKTVYATCPNCRRIVKIK
jgi:hypothetical protein